MRTRSLAAAAAVALVASLAPSMAAEAAAKPTFRVSAALSSGTADVGRAVTISGKVTGPAAARKLLLVQRQVGTGAWNTVAKVRTSTKRQYRASVKVTTAGAQQLRVVAPRSTKARQGTSTARRLTGWRWIDPTTNGAVRQLARGALTIDGARQSALVATAGSGEFYARVDGRCDALTTGLAVEGDMDSYAQVEMVQLESWEADEPRSAAGKQVSGGSGVVQTRWTLSPRTGIVALGIWVRPEAEERGGLVSPLLHCSVNSLPKTVMPELP